MLLFLNFISKESLHIIIINDFILIAIIQILIFMNFISNLLEINLYLLCFFFLMWLLSWNYNIYLNYLDRVYVLNFSIYNFKNFNFKISRFFKILNDFY